MFLHLANQSIQQQLILSDPFLFIRAVIHTLVLKQEFFIQSTIGILGWLDLSLPPIVYYICIFLLGILCVKIAEKIRTPMHVLTLGGITGILFATILSIMMYFYLKGTPVASSYVDSLQGRYLLPILPFILFIFVQWMAIGFRHKTMVTVIMGVLLFWLLGQQLYHRYYDYSRVFENIDALLTQEKELQEGELVPSITITEPSKFVYPVQYPDYKIGGFQILLNVDEKKPTSVPYQYEVKDATCSRTMRKGYLDQTELHRKHIYTQLFPILPLKENFLCLTLTPLLGTPELQYLRVVTVDEKPLINFLYIKK